MKNNLMNSTTPIFWTGTILLGFFYYTTASTTRVDLLPHQNTEGLITTFPLISYQEQLSRRGLSTTNNYRDKDGESRYRRRRRRVEDISSDPEQISSLYQGYGTHYVDLWCGTPAQRQTVIVDTGSGLTAFPCSGCEDCGVADYHIDNYFQYEQSSTFQKSNCEECTQRAHCNAKNKECRINMSYAEGSTWKAYEALDSCYIGGFHNKAITQDNGGTDYIDPNHAKTFGFPLRFGCQTTVTGLFKTQLADGIMGMDDDKSAFWHQLYHAKKIKKKQFSLCFSRPTSISRHGTGAGSITLGGTETMLHSSPMVYTSIINTSSEKKNKSGYFDVHIRKLYWRDGRGGDSAGTKDDSAVVIKLNSGLGFINRGGVIVDSGTTDSYLSSVISVTLEKNFKTVSGLLFNNDEVSLSPEELDKMPTLLLQLAGDQIMNQKVVDKYGKGNVNNISTLAGNFDPDNPLDVIVAVPPSHYMESTSDGQYVNRIYDTEEDGSVLGANVMMGHDVLFDAGNKRIGWAESACDYIGLASKNGYPNILSGGEVNVMNKKPGKQDTKIEEQEKAKEAFDEYKTEIEINEEKSIEVVKPGKNEELSLAEEIEKEYSFGEDESINKQIKSEAQEDSSITIKQEQTEDKKTVDEHEVDTKSQNGDPSSSATDDTEIKKKRSTHINDLKQQIADNLTMARGGLLVLVLFFSFLCCFCTYQNLCPPKKRKVYRRQSVREIEMKGRSSYKDDFNDEDVDVDDAEYGEYKDV